MSSPICEIKVGLTAYQPTNDGVNSTPGAAIIIRLVSGAGVNTWSIRCLTTDQTLVADVITGSLIVDPLLKTASFGAPTARPKAMIFESIVNGGVDINGRSRSDYRSTFGLYIPTTAGVRVIAANETTESNSDFGWIVSINDVIANGGGGGGGGAPPPTAPSALVVFGALPPIGASGEYADRDHSHAVTTPTIVSALAATATDVSINSHRLTGLLAPTAASHAVNRAHHDAAITVVNTTIGNHVAPTVLNAREYGVLTSNTGPQNDAAMRACLDACRTLGAGAVFTPAGEYNFSRPIEVDLPILFHGVGAAGALEPGTTIFKFAQYSSGIELRKNVNSSGQNGGADYCVVRDITLDMGFSAVLSHPTWASGAVALGSKVVPTNNRTISETPGLREGNTFEYYYECIVSGNTSGTEPNWQNLSLGVWPDRSTQYQASSPAFWGRTVRIPSRPEVLFVSVRNNTTAQGSTLFPRVGALTGVTQPAAFATAVVGNLIVDNQVVWMCTQGSSMVVVDGTVTWLRKIAAGIDAQCISTIKNVSVLFCLNAGFHFQTASTFNDSYVDTILDPNLPYPQGNSNVCSVSDVRMLLCGVGIFANGPDANAIRFSGVNVSGPGPLTETRCVAISERSFLGNYYHDVHIAINGSCSIYARGAVNSSYFSGIYIESGSKSAIYGNSIGLGLGGLKGETLSDSYFHGAISQSDWRGVSVQAVGPTGVGLDLKLRESPTVVLAWGQASAEAGGVNRLVYDPVWMGRGWWAITSSNARSSIGFSNQRAEEGYGNIRFNNGFVEGSQSDKRMYLASDDATKDPFIRFGRRTVGDHARSSNYAVRGEHAERVVVDEGFEPSAIWQPSFQRFQPEFYGNYAAGGAIVSPSVPTGYVYICIKTGTSAVVEPVWPTVVGPLAVCFPSYGMTYKAGMLVRSSSFDGTVYQVTTLAGFITDDTQFVSAEPAWLTGGGGIGTSFTDPASGITFLRAAADSLTYYVTDGTTAWAAVLPAKWEKSGHVTATATLVTVDATPAQIEQYTGILNNTVRTYKVRVTSANQTTNEAASFLLAGTFSRTSGAAVTIGALSSTVEGASIALAGVSATLVLSGVNVSVEVTGLAATTLHWRSELIQ